VDCAFVSPIFLDVALRLGGLGVAGFEAETTEAAEVDVVVFTSDLAFEGGFSTFLVLNTGVTMGIGIGFLLVDALEFRGVLFVRLDGVDL
jgi:hypothetical protein